ncbi:MAG: 4Fe-4S dicluster domain-containing protein [bacterium]|nr:4Fe-4S dicluster domain-containing protein [bacterium]
MEINLKSAVIRKIEEISGENILKCYQCGKCSAGCPAVGAMDILPNQAIRLIQVGEVDEVVNSKTVWVCASCFTCSARCPKGVDVAKVLEAVRLIFLRKNVDYQIPKEVPDKNKLPQIALISSFRKLTA